MEANQSLAEAVKTLADENALAPAQLALAWLLRKKPWIVPIPGTKSYLRLQESMSAAYVEIPEAAWEKMDRILEEIPVRGERYAYPFFDP